MISKKSDMPGIKIRKFRIEDYDALIKLWEESELPYRPKGRDSWKSLVSELKHGCAIFLVAESEGRIIGSIFGTHDGRKGWINRLAVHPDFQKKGIGKKLVAEVERRLSKIGINIVAILIEDWNETSGQAFEKMGYIKHPDIHYYTKRRSHEV
jgi:ribosomal protein S18 acetylase RimI-like enzyme